MPCLSLILLLVRKAEISTVIKIGAKIVSEHPEDKGVEVIRIT